ncbi:BTAD domain-containing putative transcriptional regulator [Peterkaempfera bronchialis]|uniref:AfsR/SARP family transcriptional regulator n=1 Tax=Peterkaempfera bronchialis TaxID=2126346 RepID=UPI003C2EFB2A
MTSPKGRLLLGALLLRANRPVSADALRSELWGERPPPTATASLHNHVARLRRLLGPDGEDRLASTPAGYVLRVRPGELDADVFTGHLRRARAARLRQEWDTVGHETSAALSLWRGQPLADLPALAGADPQIHHLTEARMQALEWRFDADLHRGRHDGLVPELAHWSAEQPLREAFHRQLMLALHRTDRRAEALDVYRRLRRALVDQLGVEPGPAIRQAHRDILADSAEPQPEPGVPSAPPVPAQLPADLVDFTGRGGQVEQVRALLTGRAGGGGAVVVSAVSGTGGIGKTALAVHAAHGLVEEFPDGQLYVDLRGVSPSPPTSAEVLARFLRDLGVPEDAVPPGEDARAARFRTLTAGRRLLLVLDNARDAAQVRPLLPGDGRCGVLVTSRRRLPGLAGAAHLHLDVLDDGDALAFFGAVVGPARAAAEPEATAAVLACCAGLPLAIRIAAARLAGRSSWPVSALAERLADERRRLDELRVDDIAVRASFQVGYTSLPAPSCGADPSRAFRLLGLVQVPDLGLYAAAALLGLPPDDAEQTLELLVDACLLDSPSPGRYRLHDLLRVYAAERAAEEEDAEERREAVRRMARWCLGTLTAADEILLPRFGRPGMPPADPDHPPLRFDSFDQALRWCESELATLLGAARAAAAHGLHELAWLLAALAWRRYMANGRYEEWHAVNEIGMSSALHLGDPVAQTHLLNSRGALAWRTGRYDEAEQSLTAKLDIHRRLGDVTGEMVALGNLAVISEHRGRYTQSREQSRHALRLARSAGDRTTEGNALNNIGICEDRLGNHREALTQHHASLAIWRELGHGAGEAMARANVGAVHLHLREYAEALVHLREALPIARAAASRVNEAEILSDLGRTMIGLDRPEEARLHLTEALGCWQALDRPEAQEVGALLDALDAPAEHSGD